jgi:hypothetical protein
MILEEGNGSLAEKFEKSHVSDGGVLRSSEKGFPGIAPDVR